jgi:hypothetical protein
MLDRRSFMFGLAGGAIGGAGLMLLTRIPYPASAGSGATDFVSNNGANQPNLSVANYPAATYASGITWMGWESWNGSVRIPQVTGYKHATGYFTDIEAVGISALVDDDHGTPVLCLDHEDHLHAFYGSHHTDQLHSSTMAPVGDDLTWRVNAPITGSEYTYPHPILVGSSIYLLLRKRIAASTKMQVVLRKTATLSDGIATWDSELTLIDLGTDSICYMGTAEVVGTDIHLVLTKADYADTIREHIYYFVYDTATGAVKNHDGSASVASGSLPVTLAQANADFRLFTHSGGNDDGGMPALCFDTSGDPHVIFKDGTGSSYAVKHIKRTSGTWDSPITVSTVDNRYNCPVLVPLAAGEVEAWYALDPGGAFTRFGNMVRRIRSAAGTWGTEQTIVAAGSDGLGNPSPVRNGQIEARVMFSENIDDPTNASAGGLRTYLYGSGGLIPYQATPPATNSGTADGKQLREDGDDELREDNSFELRETA